VSLQTRLAALITAVGADIKDLKSKTTLLSSLPIENWHFVGGAGEPAFQNSWSNLDATRTARFKKYPDGRVRLQGFIKTTGALSTAAFQLPVGYRPSVEVDFPALSNGAFGNVVVSDVGNVIPNVGSATYVCLDGVEFDTGISSVAPILVTNVTQEGWHVIGVAGEPAFKNSWVAEVGGPPPRFKKDPAGVVEVQGWLKTGTNSVAFTLPAGYRPDTDLLIPILITSGAAGGYIRIFTNGDVNITNPGGVGAFLGGISFPTTQTTFPAAKTDIPTVTTLPLGPTDGDEIYFQTAAMKVDGIKWHLQYDASAPGLYKWIFLGGAELTNYAATGETIANTSNAAVDLTATGAVPVVLPLAGDYHIEGAFTLNPSSGNVQVNIRAYPGINGSGGVAFTAVQSWIGSAPYGSLLSSGRQRIQALAAGTIRLRGSTNSNAVVLLTSWLSARPIRVG